jgi:hypothetical protein
MGTALAMAGCWHSYVVTTATHHLSWNPLATKCLFTFSLTTVEIFQVSQQLLFSKQVNFLTVLTIVPELLDTVQQFHKSIMESVDP